MNIYDIRKKFNEKIHKDTVKYQKQYGFQIGTGEHATWNNEADAFKHTYMQALISIKTNDVISKGIGYYHEMEVPETVHGERNMDLWNNVIGREIADDIKKVWGKSLEKLPQEDVEDMIAQKVVAKMKQGELITHPSDKRSFWNMKYERIKPENKVFYNGEYEAMDEKSQEKFLRQYSRQLVEDGWRIKEKSELDKEVKSGNLIYVDDYTKADGTKVHGYYRHKRR